MKVILVHYLKSDDILVFKLFCYDMGDSVKQHLQVYYGCSACTYEIRYTKLGDIFRAIKIILLAIPENRISKLYDEWLKKLQDFSELCV